MASPFLPRRRARSRAAIWARLCAALVGAAWAVSGEPEPRARRRIVRRTARRILALLDVDVRTTGRLPARGAIVAAQHVSYLDVLVLVATTDVRFVAKAEVARWPLIGGLARAAGTIFLDRDRAAAAAPAAVAVAAAAARGERIVVFPEGTTGDGRVVAPFRPALFDQAGRDGTPCVPCALRYECAPPHRPETAIAWRGDERLAPHLSRLTSVAGISVDVRFGAPRRGGGRKALAAALREDVVGLLGAAAAERGDQRDVAAAPIFTTREEAPSTAPETLAVST
jgi:1-acyl-sn-glycerol-3-phosphate acyltransferase